MPSSTAPRKLQRTKRFPSSASPSASTPANNSSSASFGSTSFVPHLTEQALEPLLGRIVDERHRRGDVRMHAGDRTSHLVSDGAIRGVPLAARAELDQVQCLSRVKLEDVADPVRKRERIRRLFDEAFRAQSLVFHARDVKRTLELAAEPCAHELVRKVGTEVRREPLPLAGQQTMALQVAERAVVGDDLEAVRQRLEA